MQQNQPSYPHPPPRIGPRGLASEVFNSQDSMMHSSRQQLEDALAFEMEETRRLNKAMKDLKLKLDKDLMAQSRLEQDIVDKDEEIAQLHTEVKELRRQKQATESELAQLTMEHINAQTKWLEQTSQLNDEISELKREKRVASAKHQAEEIAWADAAAAAVAKADQLSHPPAQKKMIVPSPTESMEHHAHTLLVNELRTRLEQLKDEISQIRNVNSRLEQENESFQLLLAEKTIQGGMSLADEFGSENEDDEDEGDNENNNNDEDDDDAGSTTLPSTSTIVDDGIADAQKASQELKQLKFEMRSLQNHNRALRVSLERLVCRLLENKKFAETIEESVPPRTIGAFSSRVASYNGDNISPHGRATRLSRGNTASTPAQWTSMLFNYHLNGNSGRRVLTLGVDDDLPPQMSPEAPLQSPHLRSASRSSMSSALSHSSLVDEDLTIELPKRSSRTSQTKLRKLHMAG